MEECIRVIDIGGAGCRKVDVFGTEIKNVVKSSGFEKFAQLLDFAKDDLGSNVKGIAYALAGVIEGHDKVKISPNAHFLDGISLGHKTKRLLEKPTIVCNDMEAAVTGMSVLLPQENYFMGITWSSGIGVRIWRDGRILLPDTEAGHMVLDSSPFAPLCGCGKRGHVEALFGGHALAQRVINESRALGIEIPEEQHPLAFMDRAFDKEEPWAVNLHSVIGRGMGIFLANIQTLFHLPLIVFKGTFAVKRLDRLSSIVRQTMKDVIINPDWAEPDNLRLKITPGLDDKDAFIGAATILRKSLL